MYRRSLYPRQRIVCPRPSHPSSCVPLPRCSPLPTPHSSHLTLHTSHLTPHTSLSTFPLPTAHSSLPTPHSPLLTPHSPLLFCVAFHVQLSPGYRRVVYGWSRTPLATYQLLCITYHSRLTTYHVPLPLTVCHFHKHSHGHFHAHSHGLLRTFLTQVWSLTQPPRGVDAILPPSLMAAAHRPSPTTQPHHQLHHQHSLHQQQQQQQPTPQPYPMPPQPQQPPQVRPSHPPEPVQLLRPHPSSSSAANDDRVGAGTCRRPTDATGGAVLNSNLSSGSPCHGLPGPNEMRTDEMYAFAPPPSNDISSTSG